MKGRALKHVFFYTEDRSKNQRTNIGQKMICPQRARFRRQVGPKGAPKCAEIIALLDISQLDLENRDPLHYI
jgi:hypothetical protein